MTKGILAGACALAVAVTIAACGGGSSSPTSPSPAPGGGSGGGSTPTGDVTITISNNAVSPQSVTVSPGSRVTFVNNDTRVHDMASDPHPSHTDCPELNQVGFLSPGQSRTSGNLNTVRTCTFHDHNQENNAALRGSVRIQ